MVVEKKVGLGQMRVGRAAIGCATHALPPTTARQPGDKLAMVWEWQSQPGTDDELFFFAFFPSFFLSFVLSFFQGTD